MNIQEPARNIPVIHEVDLCVLGGSTTGVFAAVAAARLAVPPGVEVEFTEPAIQWLVEVIT